ncbi:hypothetical protein AB3S75_034628 [Citrus x aurantiifolia]
METAKITLKLLIHKTEGRVLFAEAGKDFVDFLFYILSLPIGSIVNLLRNKNMVWCLGDLYQSIETLSETYMQSNKNKNSVLNPKSPPCPSEIPLSLPDHSNDTKPRKFYTCTNNGYYGQGGCYTRCPRSHVADTPSRSCPSCNETMTGEMTFVSADGTSRMTTAADAEKGFVKGVVTYMVMDNLEVMPMSAISYITFPSKFNVEGLGALQEKVVDFGLDEGLKLLKASMECNNVLTSVFFGKMEA